MSISMYQASIPHFIRMLGNLSSIIDKASSYAEAEGIDEAVLLDARLAPDMYPLSQQIQIAADMAKTCAARLAGINAPQYEFNEITFDDFKKRISKTTDFLRGIDSELINHSHDRLITFKLADKEVVYTGRDYLLANILPHFYFHVTTAYAILRHQGVELGKKDYLDNE
ncbi:DUF1993 domain-containing protein [Methylomarinum sp. Ch1-1]|uniref:DUF1993 domain-containing protein n=1 Tax=Methylomarinum roseum TaxID=3067653 RepID=A0AAU7NU57_9GAMM